MKIKTLCSIALLTMATLPTLSHSARWWQPNKTDFSGGGIDLDSYRNFVDTEGYEVTSMWFRGKMDKATSIYNPILGKNSITSAFTMLVQIRCETGEIKWTEFILQNRQYKTLWKASDYPEYLGEFERGFNRFYYPEPASREYNIVKKFCQLRTLELENDFSIKDLELDDYGHAIENPF